MMVHAIDLNTRKANAGGSLSLRLAWSTEQVQGQPSLGSEGKQKAGEDVIKQGDHVPASPSNQIWQLLVTWSWI